MSYNLTEQARKDAGLPGFVRGVPTKNGKQRSTVTQDDFARFKEAVDTRVGFLLDERDELKDTIDKLRDKIAKLTQDNFELSARQWASNAGKAVGTVAESLDLPRGDAAKLVNAIPAAS